ncbi:GtrA family protein [Alicyclobacillus fastidiosus]|uniref:GtrA family protein n=1 Tax=Alicyclobacillus fastidiosus TaxID=392011 RepID=A0ABY6ZNT4_9BACL|nr:GtrA family protein [Alicyclobacillus fastidiosus]WAH44487.1 GtrA family protein [Alicyclobacillus fastidiosus]
MLILGELFGTDFGTTGSLRSSFIRPYLLSNLIGIVLATVWNYALNNIWTWKSRGESGVSIERKAITSVSTY